MTVSDFNLRTALRERWGAALLAASIPLTLPWEALSALAVVVAAACAGVLLWRERSHWPKSDLRELLLISLCLLAPSALSAVDAVQPQTSWVWVAAAIRFPLLAAAIILIARRPKDATVMALAIALPIGLWLVDALVQAASGWSLGGHADADRLSGIFGSDDLKLGPVMAVFSPLLLVTVLQSRWRLLLAFVALAAVILLAGARAGWIGLAVAVAALAAYRWGQRPGRLLANSLIGLLLMLALALVGYHESERFAERVDRTAAALQGDAVSVDHALAGRLPIFATAWRISLAHPINGIGVRGFRHAYPDYAAADDPWVNPQTHTGAAHPHHLWLEVSAEQGLVGIIGLIGAHLLLIRRWLRASPTARKQALGPAVALLVLMFPFNTHPALYSSFWSAVWWWLIGLFLAFSSSAQGRHELSPASSG